MRDLLARCRRCGDRLDLHKHLRRGTDCGLCGCPGPPFWQRILMAFDLDS